MTKNRTNTISIITGAVIIVSILLALIIHLTGVKVHGSMDAVSEETAIVHAGTEINDYDLVVLEEEELPAAAAPLENKASKALWVMTAVFVLVLLVGYELWYENCEARIKALSVGDREEAGILRGVNRLHPFRAMNARREMEIKAAEVYFK
ncbi:MAG: hypothetical protein IJU25_02115 [Lachnospiraceae bacterium]|nr:hypothetical protein [Lachnospiraceae bacterium]MCR5268464.1 hypothetical protein [Lachnospiraceae bacterium]